MLQERRSHGVRNDVPVKLVGNSGDVPGTAKANPPKVLSKGTATAFRYRPPAEIKVPPKNVQKIINSKKGVFLSAFVWLLDKGRSSELQKQPRKS